MTRTKMKKIKNSNENRKIYANQRTICVYLSFSVVDNKLSSRTGKPFLFDNVVRKDKFHLTQNCGLLKTDLTGKKQASFDRKRWLC